MARTAGILIIGNEVLTGKVVDQNSPYLVRELRALGVDPNSKPKPKSSSSKAPAKPKKK